jgi:hypothetical protein
LLNGLYSMAFRASRVSNGHDETLAGHDH